MIKYLLSVNMSLTNDLSSVAITSSCVHTAFNLLKPHKREGTGLMSDHLILTDRAIEEFVASLFTCVIRLGYIPLVLRDYSGPYSKSLQRPYFF